MIKKITKFILLFTLLLTTPLFFGQFASAETVISDTAGLLSSEEAKKIEDSCNNILKRYNTSVYIVTSDAIGKNSNYEEYMESIGDDKEAPKNLILLFISTKKNERVYNIFGYGKAEKMLTSDRCNRIMDDMNSDMRDAEYYAALDTFCDESMTYMGRDPMLDSFVFSPIPQLIFCLLLACAIVFIMLRSGIGKNTTTVNTYLDSEQSKILGKIDHFTHMTESRVKHSDNDSGGNSSGGSSHSSGSSHSF